MNAPLKAAATNLGKAVGLLKAKHAAGGISVAQNDQKIGLGTAKDHLRWAQSMNEIKYSGRSEQRSDRKPSIVEATRFSYLWTASDALFSRPGVHHLIGTTHRKNDEIGNFRQLFNFAALPVGVTTAKRKALLDILRTEIDIEEPIPGIRRKTLSVWESIYFKYTSTPQKKRGIGRYMSQCILQGQKFEPDLPLLIYASRNWHFHGVLLSTSFRGPAQRQFLYYRTLNEIMAEFFSCLSTKIIALA